MLDEINKVISRMIAYDPFYGYFTSTLYTAIDNKIPTACVTIVNGEFHMLFNSEFMASLEPEGRAAVIKHELLHLVFFHLTMSDQFPDHKLANIAMDIEVNQHVEQNSGGQVLYKLPKQAITLASMKAQYPNPGWIPNAGTRYYYDLLKDLSDEQKNQLGKSYEEGAIDQHGWPDNMTSLEKEIVEQQIGDLMTKIESSFRGTIPGEFATALSNFKNKKSVFNWKSHLRNFIAFSQEVRVGKTRMRPNFYFDDRPSSKLKFKPKLLCAIDTSGSVSDKDLFEFMVEIHQIWKNGYTIDILCIDTQIHKPYAYVGQNEVKMLGRGGTYFTPTIEYFNKSTEYAQMVYFTDGYAECPPKSNKPMLWVITPGGSIEYIKEHNAKKLLMRP